MSSPLPNEVWDLVFSHLRDDCYSLGACTLVQHMWKPRARRYLFQTLWFIVNNEHCDPAGVVDVLRILPEVGRFVQHLGFDCDWSAYCDVDSSFAGPRGASGNDTIIRHLKELSRELGPYVRTLTMRFVHTSNPQDDLISPLVPALFPHVRTLRVPDGPCFGPTRWLESYFQYAPMPLRALLSDFSDNEGKEAALISPLNFPSLHTADIHGGRCSGCDNAVLWLMHPNVFRSLYTLQQTCVWNGDWAQLTEFTSHVLCQLRRLEIDTQSGDWNISAEDLCPLACPTLEVLIIRIISDYDESCDIVLDGMFLMQLATLHTLVIILNIRYSDAMFIFSEGFASSGDTECFASPRETEESRPSQLYAAFPMLRQVCLVVIGQASTPVEVPERYRSTLASGFEHYLLLNNAFAAGILHTCYDLNGENRVSPRPLNHSEFLNLFPDAVSWPPLPC